MSFKNFKECTGVSSRDDLLKKMKDALVEKVSEWKESLGEKISDDYSSTIDSMTETIIENEVSSDSCCHSASVELENAIENIDSVVMGPLQKIADAGGSVLELLEKPVELRDQLNNQKQTLMTMEVVLKILSKFPGAVGKIFATVGKTSKTLRGKLTSAIKKLDAFNKKTALAREHLESFLEKNLNISTMVESAVTQGEMIGKSIFFVQESCGNAATCGSCSVMSSALRPFNGAVDEVEAKADDLQAIFQDVVDDLNIVKTFLDSSAYKSFQSVLNGLETVLNPFKKLLDQRISIKLPAVRIKKKTTTIKIKVPNGVSKKYKRIKKKIKKCKRVWRKKICFKVSINIKIAYYVPKFKTVKKKMTIKYPEPYLADFGTSVRNLITGALSAADTIMKPLNAALDAILKKIGVPTITIPSPKFPALSIGNLNKLSSIINDFGVSIDLNPEQMLGCGDIRSSDISEMNLFQLHTSTLKANYPGLWNDGCPLKPALEMVDGVDLQCANDVWNNFFGAQE